MSKSFVKAMSEFFGKLPGQTLADFAAELKALTDKDREEIAEGLSAHFGCEITGVLPQK